MFKLLFLIPQAEICGQQTQASLEQVPLLPAPPPLSSLWPGTGMTLEKAWPSPSPGFPFSILKFPSPYHQFLCVVRRLSLQSVFEIQSGQPVPASVCATCSRAG